MVTVVVAGGGWAGCAAAAAAAAAGARAVLIERTDLLLGTGLVGGIMRNNGRFTGAEELIALGAGDLIRLTDRLARHRNLDFPGHQHASLYDVNVIEAAVRRHLLGAGVELLMQHRVIDVDVTTGEIRALHLSGRNTIRNQIRGDCFVDCTGTAGPEANCRKHGNGCAMCVLRCPAFGGRISVAARAGVTELAASDGRGVMSGSCELIPASLRPNIIRRLEQHGWLAVPLPDRLIESAWYDTKACEQYGGEEYRRHLILLDTGAVKAMVPFLPLPGSRSIPGLEAAMFIDPYAGSRGNSIRFLAISPRDNALQVTGTINLLCAGEKAGPIIGHTEAMITGTLAGHNAVRLALGQKPLVLPDTLACGHLITYVQEQIQAEKLFNRYTMSGTGYWQQMRDLDLYTTDPGAIRHRVERTGLRGVFARTLI